MNKEQIEELGELDQRVLRFKTAESVLRELRVDYEDLGGPIINPALALIVANRERMEKRINELEMGNR